MQAIVGVGPMRNRMSGASVSSVVKAQTVSEAIESKLSSCTITIGRGFPASSLPPETVQILPRLIQGPRPGASRILHLIF